jgi:hypothetical protein
MRIPAVLKASTLAFATILAAACGDPPTRPSTDVVVSPPPPPPPPPAEPTVTAIVVEGPDTVPLGETAQFRAVARMSDGDIRDLTETADWTGSQHVVLEGPGRVRAVRSGQAQVTARLEGDSFWTIVIVLPRGTYRLTGQVQHTDSGPVVGAIVEVRRGVGAGLRASTDVSGTFALFGVAGEITLRVTNPGFRHVDQTLLVDDHQEVEIRLPLLNPRFDVSGAYTLTIAAAGVCAQTAGPPLPDEVRTRNYTANITQDGATLWVSLDDATVGSHAGFFGGRVEPGLVIFNLPWLDGELPSVVERLPSLGSIVIDGAAALTPAAKGFAGRLSGRISLYHNTWSEFPISWCYSTEHRFVLSR